MVERSSLVRVLEEDPELAAGLGGEDLEVARRYAVAQMRPPTRPRSA